MTSKRHELIGALCVCVCALVATSLIGAAPAVPVDIDYFGTPTDDYRRIGEYLVSFNGMTRTPRWVLERIDKKTLAGQASREGVSFKVDQAVPAEFRPSGADYSKSGYDEGHLAPAANYGRQLSMNATFTYTNCMPQAPESNRGLWKHLENYLRTVAAQPEIECVYIVTAPMWIPENGKLSVKAIGPHVVWVPSHVGKAVLIIHGDGTREMHAWVLPNEELDAKSFDECLETVDDFERWAGLDVFAALPDDVEKKMEAMK